MIIMFFVILFQMLHVMAFNNTDVDWDAVFWNDGAVGLCNFFVDPIRDDTVYCEHTYISSSSIFILCT